MADCSPRQHFGAKTLWEDLSRTSKYKSRLIVCLNTSERIGELRHSCSNDLDQLKQKLEESVKRLDLFRSFFRLMSSDCKNASNLGFN